MQRISGQKKVTQQGKNAKPQKQGPLGSLTFPCTKPFPLLVNGLLLNMIKRCIFTKLS
jgi:hypothetical protein